MAVPSQSGLLFHRALSRRLVLPGSWPRIGLVAAAAVIAAASLGIGYAIFKSPRRQDGLPTLIGAGEPARKPGGSLPR